MRDLAARDIEAAIWGGSVLAAGGGGWVWHGEQVGARLLSRGTPRLATLDEVADDAIIATVTAIGAPAARGWLMLPDDYVRALQLLRENWAEPIIGTITAQNGSSTTLNGWTQSAVLGTLVIDAAGDGRAHPTGKMGSMGLASRNDYQTVQVAVGGDPEQGRHMEVVARGTVARTADVLRAASIQSGGFIAAARNPLPASYVREHGAVGAISYALALGEAMLDAAPRGGEAVIESVARTLHGAVLGRGPLRGLRLETTGGYDIGGFEVLSGHAPLQLSFVNEYMCVDCSGERLSTFPDVIVTLNPGSGRPVAIAELEEGAEVVVLCVDKQHVPLGSGVRDPASYPEVEAMLGVELARYALA